MEPENNQSTNRVCAVVRRHPFGLVALYVEVVIGLIAAIGLVNFLLGDSVNAEARTRYATAGVGTIILLSGIATVILLLATYVYNQNKLVINEHDLTQTLQIGLFNRKISELSMANIEDVTAEQRGIFPTLFNFGNLNIETAGEQNNFHFVYCPNPNKYAKIVLEARERFIQEDPDKAKRANELLNLPHS